MYLSLADIFWNGSLVDRVAYADVDGGRGILPISGGHAGIRLTPYERNVARLLHNMGAQTVDDVDRLLRANSGSGNFANHPPWRRGNGCGLQTTGTARSRHKAVGHRMPAVRVSWRFRYVANFRRAARNVFSDMERHAHRVASGRVDEHSHNG